MAVYEERETTIWFRTLIVIPVASNTIIDTTRIDRDIITSYKMAGETEHEIYRSRYIDQAWDRHLSVVRLIEEALDNGLRRDEEIYNYLVEEG